jgi:hypothetical protein
MSKFIVMAGAPDRGEGFDFFGTFDTEDEANEFTCTCSYSAWFVVELIYPNIEVTK